MTMVKKIYKKSLIVLSVIIILSAYFGWRIWPLSIAAGGILGLVNLKAMVWGIEGSISAFRASAILVFFSVFRLLLILIVLAWLLSHKLVNLMGVTIGFTIVFIFILQEGLVYARKEK